MARSSKPVLANQTRQLSLPTYANLEPEGGAPLLKFDAIGIAIIAVLVQMRTGIRTKLDANATVADVDILESSTGATGRHSIFLSTHLVQLVDEYKLSTGDQFYARLHEINPQSRFKKFAFKIISRAKPQPPLDDDIPH
jgi:hypothetical protein